MEHNFSTDSQDGQGAEARDVPRYAKRQRISLACTQCRKRKVKCDERQPQCSNCAQRNELCITLDPKAPGEQGVRRKTAQNPATLRRLASHSSTNHENSTSPAKSQTLVHDNSSQPIYANPAQPQSFPQATNFTIKRNSLPERATSSPQENDPAFRSNDLPYDAYDGEMMLNVDGSTHRRKMVGGGSHQAIGKYLDYFFQQNGWEIPGKRYAFGMRATEEGPLVSLNVISLLPSIPPQAVRQTYLNMFFHDVHPMFPVLDVESFRASVEVLALVQDYRSIHATDLPLLATAFAVFAMGANADGGGVTESGEKFLMAAYCLYGFVVSVPYLSAVQALVILSLALRSRLKEGASWLVLGQAIRIALSIGLHCRLGPRHILAPGDRVYQTNEELDARIWWTCYCLEKQTALECGRPSAIQDRDCSQMIPSPRIRGEDYSFFIHWTGLAQIESRVAETLFYRKPSVQNAADLLKDISQLDQDLCTWAASVEPNGISHELLCSSHELHLATFLSIYYYQTMIVIHQAALMLDRQTWQAKVEQYCLDASKRARLRSSESIIINSARNIANLQIDLADRGIKSHIFTLTQTLLAITVLGVYVMKHSNERRNRADMELLCALSRYAEAEYTLNKQDPEFIKSKKALLDLTVAILSSNSQFITNSNMNAVCKVIREHIQQYVYNKELNQSNGGSQSMRHNLQDHEHPNGALPRSDLLGELPQRVVQFQETPYVQPQLPLESGGSHEGSHDFFGNFVLDDPWRWLLTDEIGGPEQIFDMQNIT